MLNIGKFAELLSEEQLCRLKKLNTALVCDGMDELGINAGGCLPANIKPINQNVQMVGTAYTVCATLGNSLPVHYAIYNAKAGYVLIVDTKSYEHGPYLGELMAVNAKNMGLNGLIIDGYVRDANELKKFDYPIFCKGFMPKKPSKENNGDINGIVDFAGVKVKAGDAIIADEDGVVIIPRDHLDKVLGIAEEKAAKDDFRKQQIEGFFQENFCNIKGKDICTIIPKNILDKIK